MRCRVGDKRRQQLRQRQFKASRHATQKSQSGGLKPQRQINADRVALIVQTLIATPASLPR